MPALIPFIPLLAAGITAGTTIGLDLSNQPGPAPKPTPTLPTVPQAQTPATNAAQVSAVNQSIPNYIANTSGFASPGLVQSAEETNPAVANNPQASGNLQAAIQQYFGLTAPGQTGFAGQTGNPVTSVLQNLPGVSGVTGGGSLLGGGGSSIVDNLLNNQEFKGFAG